MSLRTCQHTDVREFSDGLRSCLACGETRFREDPLSDQAATEHRDYIYTDLRCLERGQTIRLVVLAPGNDDDPIHCTLVLSGIRHSDYEAVSYTWATEDGDDSKTQEVHIDGSVLKVTQNCHAALCQLRHPERHQRLWIDAICVNQLNVKERNHQVGMMDVIYQAALQVHLCITDRSHDYSIAMSWLSEASDEQSVTQVPWRMLEELWSCRYFKRVWVIQEIVLARFIILHVNDKQIAITNDVLHCLAGATTIPGPFRARLSPRHFNSLPVQLEISIRLSCSDPRDHIYGILSLLNPEVRSIIPVDYTLSVTQLYANIVTAYIKTCQNLHLLAYAAIVVTNQSVSVTRSFTVAQLHDYLLQGSPLERTDANFKPQWWSSSVLLSSQPDAVHALPGRCSQVRTLQAPLADDQILTGFEVRIYSNQVCEQSDEAYDFPDVDLDKPFYESEFMAEVVVPYATATTGSRIDVGRAFNRLLSRTQFGFNLFRTSDGLGRSCLLGLPGDRLCHVDGMSTLLLIRRSENGWYRIVSACIWEKFSRKYRLPECAEVVHLY